MRPTRLVLSLPEDSRAENHCWASNDPRLWDGSLALPGLAAHSARDSLTINPLHAFTADSFLLHGGSE